MERRLVRKIDLHILPWICISYLINYLDRVNLGNARTLNNDIPEDNMVQQLGIVGNRYSIAVAVFFVPVCQSTLLQRKEYSLTVKLSMCSWSFRVTSCSSTSLLESGSEES